VPVIESEFLFYIPGIGKVYGIRSSIAPTEPSGLMRENCFQR
jgi:hypothetical protein